MGGGPKDLVTHSSPRKVTPPSYTHLCIHKAPKELVRHGLHNPSQLSLYHPCDALSKSPKLLCLSFLTSKLGGW